MLYTLGSRLWSRETVFHGAKMRISEDARRTVVFFGAPSPDGNIEYGGTAFLVAHQEGGFWFNYVVTARHVAEQVQPDNGIVVRLNTPDGLAASIDIDTEIGWRFHPDDTVDLAVSHINLGKDEFDVVFYTLADMVRRDSSQYRVRCGDPIAVVGLFRLHPGTQRNTPVVHSGNIALLPDANEKIEITNRVTGQKKLVEAYLVEAQTFEGLSGAPVFQAEMITLKNFPDLNGGKPMALSGVQLLGIYQGAWDLEASDLVVKDRNWKGNRRVPVGMGIVVPSERLWEIVMDDPELKKQRAEVIAARGKRDTTAVTDSGLSSQSNDENPKHREDFNSLLNAAARKPKQDDQT
jgi:hypothetical protein